jgi:hypothetical protein
MLVYVSERVIKVNLVSKITKDLWFDYKLLVLSLIWEIVAEGRVDIVIGDYYADV